METPRIDRASHLRRDDAFLDRARVAPDTVLVPIWRGRALVEGRPARAVFPTVAEAPELLAAAAHGVFLGIDGGRAVFLVELAPEQEPRAIPRGAFMDLFVVGMQLPADELALIGYARGMALWHRDHAFDPKTGERTELVEGGFARATAEGARSFPRTDPAVMMLVLHEGRCLLARSRQAPPGMMSALAGFVEPGESLEACVVRETKEEVGLEVSNLRYRGSQPWPFPRSLMVAFLADATSTEFTLDPEELESARWVTKDEVRAPEGYFIPPPFSLAHQLIMGWANEP
ncbi:MAG: NAD(+) diphosphatase [Sandaracinaceae bacterium]